MSRLRKNFITGTLGGSLSTGATSISFTTVPSGLSTLSSGDYYVLIINPTPYGTANNQSEIVYMTTYTSGSTTGTISRSKDGTSASTTWASGTTYAHGLVSSDLPIDTPAPSSSNQYFVTTSTTSGQWVSSIPASTITGTLSSVTINSSTISGGNIKNTTISGNTIVSGNTFNAGSVTTSALTGSLNATTVTGVLSSNTTVPVTTLVTGSEEQVLKTRGGVVSWVVGATGWDNYSASPGVTITATATTFTAGQVTPVTGYSTYLVSIYLLQSGGTLPGVAASVYLGAQAVPSTGTTLTSPMYITGNTSITSNYYPTLSAVTYISGADPTKTYSIRFRAQHNKGTSGNFTLDSVAINVVGLN